MRLLERFEVDNHSNSTQLKRLPSMLENVCYHPGTDRTSNDGNTTTIKRVHFFVLYNRHLEFLELFFLSGECFGWLVVLGLTVL